MATQGGLCGQWLPLPLLVSCPRVIAFLVSPTLYISLSAPTLPLPPPPPHLLIPWSPLPVRVPGEAGESVRGGGGVEGWKLRNVSLFDLRGGVCWFNYLLSSLGNPIKTFWGAKFNMCVGGGRKGRGKIQISAGLLC